MGVTCTMAPGTFVLPIVIGKTNPLPLIVRENPAEPTIVEVGTTPVTAGTGTMYAA
jgi:hypothetical protein